MKSLFTLVLNLMIGVALMAQADSYQFQHEVKAELRQSIVEAPNGTYDYSFLFPKNGEYVGLVGDMVQGGQTIKTTAIYDVKNNFVVTLIDQGGMKMGMKMGLDEELPEGVDDKIGTVKIAKTGNTKKILGYNCTEYSADDDESYSIIWISTELDLPNFYDALSAINQDEEDFGANIPDGFMMHMTAWPNGKGTEEKVEMLVVEINLNQPQTISTAGYQIMEMPNR